ncbi:MAG: hypothetical protein B6U89_00410 [Desulfurococcales archaeon ex4484_58]|nr:MAG: hypothetical protein B6U89_00410 [Desulfurococcales archaeon ex4484_58]
MNKVFTILLLLSLIVSTSMPLVYSGIHLSDNNNREIIDPNWYKKLPKLLNKEANDVIVKELVIGGRKIFEYSIFPEDSQKYFIVADNDEDLDRLISENSLRLLMKFEVGYGRVIYEAVLTKEQLIRLAKNPKIHKFIPDIPSYEIFEKEYRLIRALKNIRYYQEIGSDQFMQTTSYLDALNIMDVIEVWDKYNITGEGVVVGVVDTGIDFSIPDLGNESIARDNNGYPLVMTIDYGVFLFTGSAVNINGTLNTTGLKLIVYDPYFGTIGVIELENNITVGNITSASGIYKVGMGVVLYLVVVADTPIYYLIYTPAIMVDSTTPGRYDRVYFDLSTTFYELLTNIRSFENITTNTTTWREPDPSWEDYSIVDEPWFGPGREIVARDFDFDGIFDFSLGVLAGYYLDRLGLVNATVSIVDNETMINLSYPGYYHGWDYSGGFVALMNDYMGHGTAVASLIAGRGKTVHTGVSSYILKGVAPSAKLATGFSIDIGGMLYLEAWLAGYNISFITVDNYTQSIILNPYGPHRTDIISNSWGLPSINFAIQQFPGTDYFAWIIDDIVATRNYIVGDPVTIVFAAGNEGPGYSSLSSPGAGLLTITVGASTSFKFMNAWMMPSGQYDDVIPFSSRGPNALGYPKPDVLAIGAFEWASVRTIDGKGYGVNGYLDELVAGLTLFGGTSEATPLTSGVIALMYQAFREKYGYSPDAITVKTILKSSADDIDYPVFMQGVGRVNALRAVETILDNELIVKIGEGIRSAFIENYLNVYGYLIANLTEKLYDTAYYGVVMPGTIKNITLEVIGNGTIKLSTREPVLYKEYTVYSGIYDFNHTLFIQIPRYTYTHSDYLEVIVLLKNMSGGFTLTPKDVYHLITVLLFDWRDHDQDHEIDYYLENYFLSLDYRLGVESILSIAKPEKRIEGTLVAMIQPPIEYLELMNITPQPIQVVVRAYKYIESDLISYPDTVYVNGSLKINISVRVPGNERPGIREIGLIIETKSKKITVPLSILIPLVLDNISTTLLIGTSSGYRYDQFVLQAPYDILSWECKDWRILPIIVTNPEITGVLFIARWASGAYSDLEFLVIPPNGVFNEYGTLNYFASYKLAYDTGLIYNPSIRDQLNGKLRTYLPIKWGLPSRFVDIRMLDLRWWPPYYDLYSPIVPYPNIRATEAYGLYRVIYSFGAFNGRDIEDHVSFRIITVKASAKYVELNRIGEQSTGYIEYEFKAGAYTPFIGSKIYLVTNSTYTYPLVGELRNITTSVIINGTLTNLTYDIQTSWPGYYIETTLYSSFIKGKIPIVANITESPEINIVLVTYRYPWHSEGTYWHDWYTGEILLVELVYPGIIAASLHI